ncbi:Nramp family divalent metal transporter [Fontivita pretiosa]|uniref:Nramp family divalent metal transporter n=1 Tax=Fontivita pretiosa TaxID=2989684 RepID=UPI003D167B62
MSDSVPASSCDSGQTPVAGSTGGAVSLEEVHRSVPIPHGRWRRLLAFAGPAYLVSVGYMDPGNWATDIEGGARFGYQLIFVLLMSNLMAVLMQSLAARLGLVTGQDLAQACRESYGPAIRWILFVLCEIAIAACDLAEALGTAIGINLLTGLPLTWAVLLTALDVLLLLAFQRFGIRKIEALIVTLVLTIGLCFVVEIFLSKPSIAGIASGFLPRPLSGQMLVIAIGILGATVMPHNLYLHSALVQSRDVVRTEEGIRQACRYNLLDSAVALNAAFFVNCAILIVAAATFWTRGIAVTEIQQAHTMLERLLGTRIAPIAFAVALICAGQSSTITGTLAGQVTMEGFIRFRLRPWLRRLITRSLAIVPAVVVINATGDQGTYRLLILSQVILSLQLPFAVVPLVKFTSSRRRMGAFASSRLITLLAWLVAAIIISLNAKLVWEQIAAWAVSAGRYGWLVLGTTSPLAAGLGLLLLWMIFRREDLVESVGVANAREVVDRALTMSRTIRRIGVALGADGNDAPMLAEAIAVARTHHAQLILMHVVEGVGGQYHGAGADDVERRQDETYLSELAAILQSQLDGQVDGVRLMLGYGNVRRELVRLAREAQLDLLIVGGHGHRGLDDILRGTTIDGVRHSLAIPVVAVPSRQPASIA